MKVRVGAVIVKDGALLLMEHKRRGRTYWTIPGGRLKEDETIEDCLKREL
jgi:ADP-ribose pyrophosphatase YjhB (NUDIX family)